MMSNVNCPPISGFDGSLVNSDCQASIGPGKLVDNNTPNRILLVDDDASVRRMTATILKDYGYNVIEADSGFTGLDLFVEYRDRIGLVLADVMMPHMTGPEMIEKILALDTSIPVMLMSGFAVDSSLPRAVPILPKPFTPAVLLRAARSRLS